MANATIIDGKAIAAKLSRKIAKKIDRLQDSCNLTPNLAVVLVGEDPASQIYVRNKNKQVEEVGMTSSQHDLPADIGEEELLILIRGLNKDPNVHGILVQLPLPVHIDTNKVIGAVNPAKDVDGFHVLNAGALMTGQTDALVPCTPLGCLMLIKEHIKDLGGSKAVVVGRSNIVGKPMAQLLLRENCTVTMAHSRTRELADECRQADILVGAVGRPELIRGDWIKPGATVIDVGINRIQAADGKKLVGDVAFDEALAVAGAITPVPGGVGPMTIACMLSNTLKAACQQNDVDVPEL
ncbi:MAG: bifunctional methylenetetrahydrofolate dehydrogenase/methenyltetrahydrofolate cyclohydrolase FolD [Rhodospirillaceae bacterium]|jgi:methylenetetrahydrofolate dehydrogenase (NADP+)/methenyltetrahydrofolate cyclohydrolase